MVALLYSGVATSFGYPLTTLDDKASHHAPASKITLSNDHDARHASDGPMAEEYQDRFQEYGLYGYHDDGPE